MNNDFITIPTAAKLWRVEPEQIRLRCAEGCIPGARRVSRIWLIPVRASVS